MAAHWYVLHAKRFKIRIVKNLVQHKGFEVFCPQNLDITRDAQNQAIHPYYSDYLFVRVDFDQHNISELQNIPFTVGLVTHGDQPAYVPDTIINAVRKRLAASPKALNEYSKWDAELFEFTHET